MLLPQSTYCSEGGVANFDPHENKVDVITPVNTLFIEGGKFQCYDGHVVMIR